MNESRDELDRLIDEKQRLLIGLDRQMKDKIAELKKRFSQQDMAEVEALLKLQEGHHLAGNTVLRLKEIRLAEDPKKQEQIARIFKKR